MTDLPEFYKGVLNGMGEDSTWETESPNIDIALMAASRWAESNTSPDPTKFGENVATV